MKIQFVDVYNAEGEIDNSHVNALYRLLSERRPWQNISHKKMPTLEEHIKFLTSKPYKHWYLVKDWELDKYKPVTIGAVYITHNNEIGIFLYHTFINHGYGSVVLESIFKKHTDVSVFRANVAPTNSHSLAFFCNKGFVFESDIWEDGIQIQYTFKKTNPYYVASGSPSSAPKE